MTDLFAGINDGDKIRVEYEGGGAIEGAVAGWYIEGPRLSLGPMLAAINRSFVTCVTVLQRALPPEPAVGSIVVDEMGVAWQRVVCDIVIAWCSTHGLVRTWAELNAGHGPLRLAVIPGDDK